MKPLLVIMGVTGSGKTTVGKLLAESLAVPFAEGDNLHSLASIRKMAAGHPLNDEDRRPWLQRVGEALVEAEGTGLVITCSALKRSYRDALLAAEANARFVFLDGPRELLETRLGNRRGHFMPTELLDSQLATLETLEPDEPGFTVGIDQAPEQIVADILAKLAPQ